MGPRVRAAAVQLRVTGDPRDNLRRAADLVARAAREGAEVVALPECFTGTYGVAHFARWAEIVAADPSGDDGAATGSGVMAKASRDLGIVVTGGVVERDATTEGGERLYNAMPVYDGGALRGVYRKTHLSRVLGVTSESDVFAAGDAPLNVEVQSPSAPRRRLRVGLACCFDLRFPGFLAAYAGRVDVLCAPSAFLDVTGRDHWELLARRTALDAQAYVVAPNVAYDAADAVPLHGHSMLVDPWGRVLASCSANGDDLAIADLDTDLIDDVRSKLPIGPLARWAFHKIP